MTASTQSGPIVAVAVIWAQDRLVLQLRDFRRGIADPGEWGFFGGHLLADEPPHVGLRRELLEELSWTPVTLEPLGSFVPPDGPQIIGCRAQYAGPLESLVLGEGQELGAFDPSELRTGCAYSRRWRRDFPLTAITRHGLRLWSCRVLTI